MPSGTSNTRQQVVTGAPPTPILPPNGTRAQGYVRVVTASSTVFVGGPNVTTGNGFPIKDTDTQPYSVTSTDGLWGITSGASITVAVAEINQD